MCRSRDPVAVGFLLGAGSTIHVESPLLREELLASSPKPTVRLSRVGKALELLPAAHSVAE